MRSSCVARRGIGVVGAVLFAVWCTGCNRPPTSALPQQQQRQVRGNHRVDRDVDAAHRGLALWPAIIDGLEYPVVMRVSIGGPGDQMGVQPGDIMLSYDGADLSAMSRANNILGRVRQAAHDRGEQDVEVIMIPMGSSKPVVRIFPVGGAGAEVVVATRQ